MADSRRDAEKSFGLSARRHAKSAERLGAIFGYSAIPEEYVEGLIYREQLDNVIEKLADICIPQIGHQTVGE